MRKLGIESCPNSSKESGGERNITIYSRLFTTAVVENELQFVFKNFSPSQKSQLTAKIVYIPKDDKFDPNSTSSAEDLLNVTIDNDRSQNTDLMLTIIKVYKTLEINEIHPKYKWHRKFSEPKRRLIFIKLPIIVV